MTFIRPFRLNYGDGSDGNITITSNNDWKTLWNKQTLNCTDFTLNSGVTLTLNTDYKPHLILCKGTCTINGTINGNGLGFAGGTCESTQWNRARGGDGPGGGRGGLGDNTGNGGGGAGRITPGTAGSGTHGGAGGPINDPMFLAWLLGLVSLGSMAGSGGGAGGPGNGTFGSSGGAGGADLWIVARNLVVASTALITLNGAAGGSNSTTAGAAGGGSGGALCAAFEVGTFYTSGIQVTTTGGAAGTSSGGGKNGGAGANGMTQLFYLQGITADAANRCNPVATIIDLRRLPILLG